MRRLILLLLPSLALFSCGGKSEKLSDDELEYVNLSAALGRVKAHARDSADHARLRDSVFRAFSTTQDAFKARTESMTEQADRTNLIFRAIEDSLGIR